MPASETARMNAALAHSPKVLPLASNDGTANGGVACRRPASSSGRHSQLPGRQPRGAGVCGSRRSHRRCPGLLAGRRVWPAGFAIADRPVPVRRWLGLGILRASVKWASASGLQRKLPSFARRPPPWARRLLAVNLGVSASIWGNGIGGEGIVRGIVLCFLGRSGIVWVRFRRR